MTRFNTQLVHGLPVGDNNTGAVNPPIYNSTTYAFERVDAMPRYDYARSGNPTRDFLEQQIAQLEQGTRGFAFASGLAAIHAVLSIFKPGDRIVVGDNIYGGSYSQLNEFFTRWGIIVEAVDTQDIAALEAAVKGDRANGIVPAQAVYFETLTNPLLKVNDVRAISTVAHRFGALSIVDNTFVTPYLHSASRSRLARSAICCISVPRLNSGSPGSGSRCSMAIMGFFTWKSASVHNIVSFSFYAAINTGTGGNSAGSPWDDG